ncbi:uncharacterized protein BX663DRAFT_512790 [Cokeromyces recurvatus]|uniref:uncharacterized protein n=1 Tax=Cokeromyces recurvatus TaxID=90255 RepID=UPI00221FFA85|nr:uncharacterized protein BX663DRAFT_512790 [Cokeromyces recurvatus]KAI7901908.1 hypothetical protein BX663DRAFT_512790 [Cokeromyces recurvatus]
MLSKSSCISVQLLEPTIYVDPNSELSNVIRGTININFSKTMTVKSISVRFDGKMETKSYTCDVIDNAGDFIQKKPLTRQSLILYPTLEQEDTNRPLIINAGLTQFGFEMQVPSKLPESIECSDIHVYYYVTAVIEYYNKDHSFFSLRSSVIKELARQHVQVTRLPYESILLADAMSSPIDSRTHHCGWLNYQIVIDKKAVALGSNLPITFRITPTCDIGVSIDRIHIQMLERRDLHRLSTHTTHSVHTILPCNTNNKASLPKEPLREDQVWEDTIMYKIPGDKELVHSTQEYSDFSVSHTLLITITLSTIPSSSNHSSATSRRSPRTQKMVTFQAHIDILDETLGELESLKLPTYDAPPPFEDIIVNHHHHHPSSVVDYTFPTTDYDDYHKLPDPPAYNEIFA